MIARLVLHIKEKGEYKMSDIEPGVDDWAAIKWLFGILACFAIAVLAAELL